MPFPPAAESAVERRVPEPKTAVEMKEQIVTMTEPTIVFRAGTGPWDSGQRRHARFKYSSSAATSMSLRGIHAKVKASLQSP